MASQISMRGALIHILHMHWQFYEYTVYMFSFSFDRTTLNFFGVAFSVMFLISNVIKLKMSTVFLVLLYRAVWCSGQYLWFSFFHLSGNSLSSSYFLRCSWIFIWKPLLVFLSIHLGEIMFINIIVLSVISKSQDDTFCSLSRHRLIHCWEVSFLHLLLLYVSPMLQCG